MDQNFTRSDAHCGCDSHEDVLAKQKTSQTGVHLNVSGCFDCNICFDTAQEPIITLCGHLYCWPCIYKWLHVQTSADSDHHQQNCPVCKANISVSSLVPLYGRGMSTSEFGSKKHESETMSIPHRPSPSASNSLMTSASTLNPTHQLHQAQSQAFSHQQYLPQHYGGYTTMESTDLTGSTMTSFFNPMIGMFGDMVYARIFGTYTNMFAHPYQNMYPFVVGNSHRMRRQEMQLNKSLHRVSIFLLCCIILCLLLF